MSHILEPRQGLSQVIRYLKESHDKSTIEQYLKILKRLSKGQETTALKP